jgi:hypothetical protein
MKNMKRQTAVKQSSLYSAPLFIALFSILATDRLVARDLELMRVGGYETSGFAWAVAVSGNYAYVEDRFYVCSVLRPVLKSSLPYSLRNFALLDEQPH